MSLAGRKKNLQVITCMRRGWSTALASLFPLPLHAWHNHLPSFIYRLREQGHLRAPAKVRSFFPVSLLIFWEADRCCESRTPKQTPSHTTWWNTRNESYNSCILICHCLTLAVEKKHHLKTQRETSVRTCDTAGRHGGWGGGGRNTYSTENKTCVEVMVGKFTAEFWNPTTHWNPLSFSELTQWFHKNRRGVTSTCFPSLYLKTSDTLWLSITLIAAVGSLDAVPALFQRFRDLVFFI